MKYYAVKNGRKPGVYDNWADCQNQVSGFSNAQFKSFPDYDIALEYVKENNEKTATNKATTKPSDIVVYTDGGCRLHGNRKDMHVLPTDKSGWAYCITGNYQKKSYGGFFGKTNNQMELAAVLQAVHAINKLQLNHQTITLVSDSKYIINGLTQYMPNWIMRNFANVKNAKLWRAINDNLNNIDNINFKWTKGHAVNEGNIKVDALVNQAMDEL